MGNWLDKLLGKGPKPYSPVSPNVKFLDSYEGNVEHTMPIVVIPPKQQYIIRSGDELQVYNSKEEMPQELRDEIERIEKIDKISSSYTLVINGKRQIFNNFEDIPPEIQAAIKNTGE